MRNNTERILSASFCILQAMICGAQECVGRLSCIHGWQATYAALCQSGGCPCPPIGVFSFSGGGCLAGIHHWSRFYLPSAGRVMGYFLPATGMGDCLDMVPMWHPPCLV